MSTKKELIREVAESGITQKRAREVIESLLEVIKERLEEGEPIRIMNFGRFEVRDRTSRTMTNPNTGEEHHIPARKIIHFTPSERFKQRFRDDS